MGGVASLLGGALAQLTGCPAHYLSRHAGHEADVHYDGLDALPAAAAPGARAELRHRAALVLPSAALEIADGRATITGADTVERLWRLCAPAGYDEQAIAASREAATATVVCDGTVLTARHVVCPNMATLEDCRACYRDGRCPRRSLVFGWEGPVTDTPVELDASDVYPIEAIVAMGEPGDDRARNDWILVTAPRSPSGTTDRVMVGEPLPLAEVAVGMRVFAFAVPLGLPLTYLHEAEVLAMADFGNVATSIDASSGCSGAPLFDDETMALVGIHRGSGPPVDPNAVLKSAIWCDEWKYPEPSNPCGQCGSDCVGHGCPWSETLESSERCRLTCQDQLADEAPVHAGPECSAIRVCRPEGCCRDYLDSQAVPTERFRAEYEMACWPVPALTTG
jgi:hypothetical protein